jgi:Na+/H+ antiporter NhaC
MAFACSLLFSLSTGSVWGAIAVLMPIAWSTLAALCCAQEAELLAPTLAALISGGIAGSHLCMAGDATILSASSAGADHPLHTMTMSAYALPVIIIAALQTLAAGFVTSTKMLLLIHASGITLLIATLQILHTLYHRR